MSNRILIGLILALSAGTAGGESGESVTRLPPWKLAPAPTRPGCAAAVRIENEPPMQ